MNEADGALAGANIPKLDFSTLENIKNAKYAQLHPSIMQYRTYDASSYATSTVSDSYCESLPPSDWASPSRPHSPSLPSASRRSSPNKRGSRFSSPSKNELHPNEGPLLAEYSQQSFYSQSSLKSSDAGAAESVLDHLLGDVGMEEQGWATLSAADAEYLAIHHLHQKAVKLRTYSPPTTPEPFHHTRLPPMDPTPRSVGNASTAYSSRSPSASRERSYNHGVSYDGAPRPLEAPELAPEPDIKSRMRAAAERVKAARRSAPASLQGRRNVKHIEGVWLTSVQGPESSFFRGAPIPCLPRASAGRGKKGKSWHEALRNESKRPAAKEATMAGMFSSARAEQRRQSQPPAPAPRQSRHGVDRGGVPQVYYYGAPGNSTWTRNVKLCRTGSAKETKPLNQSVPAFPTVPVIPSTLPPRDAPRSRSRSRSPSQPAPPIIKVVPEVKAPMPEEVVVLRTFSPEPESASAPVPARSPSPTPPITLADSVVDQMLPLVTWPEPSSPPRAPVASIPRTQPEHKVLIRAIGTALQPIPAAAADAAVAAAAAAAGGPSPPENVPTPALSYSSSGSDVELPATMGDAIQGLLETAPAAGWLQWANATADAPLPGASEVLPAVKDVGGDERTADDSLDGGDEMLSPNSAPLLSRAHAPVGPGGEPAVVSTTALSEEDLASKPLAEAQAGTAAAETRPETEDEVMRASVTDSAAAAASRPRVTFQDEVAEVKAEVAEVEPRNVVVEAPASPGQEVLRLLREHPEVYVEVKATLFDLRRNADGRISEESLEAMKRRLYEAAHPLRFAKDVSEATCRQSYTYNLLRSLELVVTSDEESSSSEWESSDSSDW